jgi:thiamine biosynthesis lipoprotein ApbE
VWTLNLANAVVSTSGNLEQFVVINGVRYSHMVDPKTGLGLTGQRSVTVIAPKGITADSMTKVLPGITHMYSADPTIMERLWVKNAAFFKQHLGEPK